MPGVFDGFAPESVYRFFEEIARVPRDSFHEKKISDWLVNFAAERGIDCVRDECWNVVMSVPATPGYEGRKKIILQGHMDMVCVADAGVEHDFENDPIELARDGDYVRAVGTTLGADDGSALALMLAVLDDKNAPHPALQCVFTAAEEVGMIGAMELDASLLDGDYMIGLDYSRNTGVLVSGAGCREAEIALDMGREACFAEGRKAFALTVSGLRGGHSGVQIILGRACAIRVMGEALSALTERFGSLSVHSFTGGEKANSIAAASRAVVSVRESDAAGLTESVRTLDARLRAEYEPVDPGLTLAVVPTDVPALRCARGAVKSLLSLLDLLPSGAQNYLDAERTLVKSSANFGTLREENGSFALRPFFRSNSEYQMDQLSRRIRVAAERCGASCAFKNRSPAWEFDPRSPLNSKVQDIWERTRGFRPPLVIVHGGVEPGIFIEKMARRGRRLEAVNIGPNTRDAHSTRERMEIATLGQTYELLSALLRDLD